MASLRFEITKRPTVHPEELERAVRGAFEESGPVIETAVKAETPEGVGGQAGLKGSLFTEIRTQPAFVESLTSSPLVYAAPVEFGRRAGQTMPPPKALVPWVEKFIPLKPGEQALSVAYAIARAIGIRGTRAWRQSPPGVRMFQRGFEKVQGLVERIFADRVREGAIKVIRN